MSTASDELASLRSDPPAFARELELLADSDPFMMKEWIQEHPRNLMAFHAWSIEPFHQDALNDVLIHRSFMWLAPRGAGKSLAICVNYPAWLAIADPDVYTKAGIDYLFPKAPRTIGPHNIRIAMTSNSMEKAVTLQWMCKQILASSKMEALFGPMEGKRWRDHMSDTALRTEFWREGTFTSLGLGSKVTGGHYDVVITDDWVTEDNARTEFQRSKLSSFWKFTVAPTREPWARVIAAGTRYHPQDWYQEIKDWTRTGLWDCLRRTPAVTGTDDKPISYWPKVYPIDALMKIKAQVGAIAFATQYQNETDIMLGEFFDRQMVENFAKWEERPESERANARTLISLDPAIKAGPRNDYSVFTVLSYIAPWFHVRRVVRGQWTQHELIQISQRLYKQYRAEMLGIEVVQGQEWLVQELQRQTSLRIRALRPQQFKGKDKVGRETQVRTLFEQSRVVLEEPTSENGIGRLIEEMMAFPNSAGSPGMDDCVDSLIWGLLIVARPRARLIRLHDRRYF